MTPHANPDAWWRDAVIYQIYPRSWADANGDGIGDLSGITARLGHLVELGVDAVWLSPFYVSPQHDAGYDIADHCDVDPMFGTLADADRLIATAHALGLRVVIDLVPNHSSDQHRWFQQALRAAPHSPERARYLFRDGKGMDGSQPPNNWQSSFGGPAWTRVPDPDGRAGQWYLHLFDASQPDFDWSNPDVAAHLESIIVFWLDRGVDGFRIDVAHGLVKAAGLPDRPLGHDFTVDDTALQPMWDQPGVHDIYRRWRSLVDKYSADHGTDDRLLCAEAWVLPADSLARYVRPDELHQSFNFEFLMTPWIAADLRAVISRSLAVAQAVGAPQTWVLSNHDVVRHATRLGYPQTPGLARMPGIGADDPQPDPVLGLRRARAASTVMLALPGSAYLYQGEELGLVEATELPDALRQDPTWLRSGHTSRGRDGCRVPVPWSGTTPSYGFGPSANSWLPQPAVWAELTPEVQTGVPGSTLELYRALLAARRRARLGRGRLSWVHDYGPDVVAFRIATTAGDDVLVLANLGTVPVRLTASAQVLIASDELLPDGRVPTDVAVWIALPGTG